MPSQILMDRMVQLARLVASTSIVGRVPEPLIEPLLRAEALARAIVAELDERRAARSGIPIVRNSR